MFEEYERKSLVREWKKKIVIFSFLKKTIYFFFLIFLDQSIIAMYLPMAVNGRNLDLIVGS